MQSEISNETIEKLTCRINELEAHIYASERRSSREHWCIIGCCVATTLIVTLTALAIMKVLVHV